MTFAVPPTHRERIAQLDAQYDLDTLAKFKPFGYPWGTYGVLLVILYMLIPHANSPLLRRLRFVVWTLNTAFSVYAMIHTRARGAVLAYGLGFGYAWSILWTTAVMIVHDGQLEFSRIERVCGATGSVPYDRKIHRISDSNVATINSRKPRPLISQPYPTHSILERLDWILDLMTNFRGMAWNWRISNLPEPPKEVLEQIRNQVYYSSSKIHHHKEKKYNYPNTKVLLRTSLRNFIQGYFVLDVVKTMIINDPFFILGGIDIPGPSYLPKSIRSSPVLMSSMRLILAQLALYWALQTIFQLASLFFVGVLGSDLIGVRGQHWMYPREWGSYWSVLDRGLGGWWGDWWHQTFRFAFEAPSKKIVEILKLERRSLTAKSLQLFIAFALSGFLHASGSYTSVGETRPVRGPFLFFILQPFGIMAQIVICRLLKRAGISQRTPKIIRQLVNFVLVHTWFYYTAPPIVEDLAAGGQFLYEPVPISPLRLLGFGTKGDSWYCWNGHWLRLYRDQHWWESGIVT